MAITIEANYSKKIGLPCYSSHQYSLTLRAELSDLNQVGPESQRLHGLLQASVDRELQQAGWLPAANGAGGHPPNNGNGNGHSQTDRWNCTSKQQALILKIVEDNRLDKAELEKLALDRFGKGVRQLNTLDASGFIEELFERYPRQRNGPGYQPQRSSYASMSDVLTAPALEARKCLIGQLLDPQVLALLDRVPRNPQVRALVLKLAGKLPPPECETFEQVKEWIELHCEPRQGVTTARRAVRGARKASA